MIDEEPDQATRELRRPDRVTVRSATTVRIARRGRQPGVLLAVVATFLVLALVKPWAGPARVRLLVQGSFELPSATPAGSAGADSIAAAALQAQCGEPLGWSVFTREGWNGQMVRAWRFVEPSAAASGPLDPAVPLIRVGPTIAALGYCSPWGDAERPPDGVTISAWRIGGPDATNPAAIAVRLESVVPGWPVGLGALFSPDARVPDRAAGGNANWSLGRYVFALRTPDWERWWAVNIPSQGPA